MKSPAWGRGANPSAPHEWGGGAALSRSAIIPMDTPAAYYTLVCDQTPSSDYWFQTVVSSSPSRGAVGVLPAVLAESPLPTDALCLQARLGRRERRNCANSLTRNAQ